MAIKFYASYGATSGTYTLNEPQTISVVKERLGRAWGVCLTGYSNRSLPSMASLSDTDVVANGMRLEFVKPAGDKG